MAMSDSVLAITNVCLGMANIGAGIGFGTAEHKKMKELNRKAEKLKKDVEAAGDLYDRVYYLLTVNLDRVKKAVDKLPSDMLDALQQEINKDIKSSQEEEAIKILATTIGYLGNAVGLGSGILQIVRYSRTQRAQGKSPPPEENTFVESDLPLAPGQERPAAPAEQTSSLSKTPKLDRCIRVLNVAGIVFGLAGLAATVGLGLWTLDKLHDAIEHVKVKQEQVTKFHAAMEEALDPIVEAAGLPAKSYDQLTEMTDAWKNISEEFHSYEKATYYAIRGYFMNKPLREIKEMVDHYSDAGKPYNDDAYPLAKTLADDIKHLFDENKTDKEIVTFFATDHPKIGLRFVFDEFFISSLRWIA